MGLEPPETKPNYRQEAEAIRAKAGSTRDAEARDQLLVIAWLYDKLAEHVPLLLQAKRLDDPRQEDHPEGTDSASEVTGN
jgi:hypothetical protein